MNLTGELHLKKSQRGSLNFFHFFILHTFLYLIIGSYVSVCSSRYEAHRKFEEHERCVRVARGVAESNSSFVSAL